MLEETIVQFKVNRHAGNQGKDHLVEDASEDASHLVCEEDSHQFWGSCVPHVVLKIILGSHEVFKERLVYDYCNHFEDE